MQLKFEKKVRRDTALTVRLSKKTVEKLKDIADKHGVSQADVLEKLIEAAHSGSSRGK